MCRLALLLVLSTVVGRAQSTDFRLPEVSRAMAQRAARAGSPGARLARALAESRARLRNAIQLGSAGDAALREEGATLAATDRQLEAEFHRVEATLRGAGLAPEALAEKLAAWDAFTAHSRSRMRGVLAAVGRGDASSAQALLAEADSPPQTIGGAIPSSRPAQPAEGPAPAASLPIVPPADDLPTKGDLVNIGSASIRALAAACGNSPAALYAFVHDQIEIVPYRLAMLNAEGVLWARRGSDVDQATLLIALLRSAGIPARYVRGYFQIPYADVINWMGTKDLANGTSLLNDLTTYTDLGGSYSIRHTWVEAWIDSGAGPRWVAMAPAIKTRTFQSGIVVQKPLFDRLAFLAKVNSRLATESYLDQLLALVRQTQPGAGLGDLAFTSAIVPASASQLPALPYTPQSITWRDIAVPTGPTGDDHTVTIKLANASGQGPVYFTTNLSLPTICIESIVVSFTPATTADAQVVAAFGGLDTAPAAIVNLLPQLRLDDTIFLTSKNSVTAGSALTLEVSLFLPSATAPTVDDTHNLTAGQSVAIGLNGSQVHETLLSDRINRLLGLLTSGAADDVVTREFLNVAVLRYFQRMGTQKDNLARAAQLRFSSRRAEEAAVIGGVTVQKLFDRPFYLVPGSLLLDAKGMLTGFLDLNAPSITSAVDRSLRYLIETASSGLENQLWEELVLAPSISTVKALQLASQSGQQLATLTNANAAAQLGGSQIPQSVQTQMLTDAGNGATIIAALSPVTYNDWTGIAWIRDFPDGEWAYLIQASNGGATTGVTPPMPPTSNPGTTGDPTSTGGTLEGDPVSMSNGNLFEQETDFVLSSRGPALRVTRTYNSLLAASDGPFGFGWSFNYNMSLRQNGTAVTFVDENGGRHSFAAQGGAWASPPGLDLSLTSSSAGFTLRNPGGTQWSFSTAGSLQSITDRNGNAVQLTYSSPNVVQQVTGASGAFLLFAYDSSNHIVRAVDLAGRSTQYSYDSAGRLISFTDAAGNRTRYAYTGGAVFPNGIASITTAAGRTTSYQYFGNGQVAEVTEAGGRHMHFSYLPLENETVYIDDRGYTSYYFYNALGNVTRVGLPDGNVIDTIWSADAKPLSSIDETGYAATFAWDANGNMTSATDSMGNVRTFTYEPVFNHPTSATDALGNVTRYEYDSQGNLIHTVAPLGVETHYTYDGFGDVLTFTDGEGNTWTYAYDAAGDRVSTTDPLGNVSRAEFDNLSRRTAATDALGGTSRYQYDALGRITAAIDANTNATTMAYDADGNLASLADAKGGATRYAYDPLDQLTAVTDPAGKQTQYATATLDCQCLASPDISTYRDAAGRGRSFTYDSRDRPIQATDAAGFTTVSSYDGHGRPVRRVDANGNAISFLYDAGGRVVRKSYPDGTADHFTYDQNNNLLTASNKNSTLTFTYDALKRTTSVADSRFPGAVLYGYDRNSRRTALTDPTGGIFAYGYDQAGHLVSIANPAGGTAQFGYDAAGRTNLVTFSNGTAAVRAYDPAGHPTVLIWFSAAGSPLQWLVYGYDPNGNPLWVADAGGRHQYQYDALNRLTAAVHPALAAESYAYDAAGNRTSSASDPNYSYDNDGRVTAAEGASYTWDQNGNLTQRRDAAGATAYTYDFNNRLVSITFPNGTTATYKYDALGRRIEKNVNGAVTRYLYDGTDILLELDGAGQLVARYTHGPGTDQPLIMERGGRMYYYHADANGSVLALSGATGAAVVTYAYDSFGRPRNFDPATQRSNPYRFAGREYDAESGLYYLRARYYDAATGRFLSQDPLDFAGLVPKPDATLLRQPQLFNLYSYAMNNPLVFRDPSGLSPYHYAQFQLPTLYVNPWGQPPTETELIHGEAMGFLHIMDSPDSSWWDKVKLWYHVIDNQFVGPSTEGRFGVPHNYPNNSAIDASNQSGHEG